MPRRRATSIGQRRELNRLVEEGRTYAEAAEEVGVSFWTGRKYPKGIIWVRRGKRDGVENLGSCYGRPKRGEMVGFDPLVRYVVLRLKKEHPKWGPDYVKKKLKERVSLRGEKYPVQ